MFCNRQTIDCLFFEFEFCDSGQDWLTDQRLSVTLKESIEYLEKLKKLNGERNI